MTESSSIILNFYCEDRPGIVAAVTTAFAGKGFTIVESSQFQDPQTHCFFMRTEYRQVEGDALAIEDVRSAFEPIAQQYGMRWGIAEKARKMPVLIGVSKWGHCLNRMLDAWKHRDMPIDIVGVFSNHEDLRDMTEWYGVPYHYLPVAKDNRKEQESRIWSLFQESGAELAVLARYMQILSDDLVNRLSGRAINIHHSFLPGFKGARPYHQAYAKGVKLIGATAHYVTRDLDEGPIIEQSVLRVSHAETPSDLIAKGQDVEARVLSTAVKWHAERRVMLSGSRTIVFDR